MPINPVERMNVFREDLSTILRERSKSSNLLQTRAPFLRFTTAAIMSDIATKMTALGSTNADKFSRNDTGYNGYEFFTLGIHGFENQYSFNDLYGTQGTTGLVIGTTYKEGEQKLVKTYGGQLGGEPAKNYPPPGITSAKVERTRNGNVLKFTIETQCYTQEQLEMLDVVCYVPGMTCILEWGTIENTRDGIKRLKTLNFKNVSTTKKAILDAFTESRTIFIGKYCTPNKYNYDWTVANISNVKTVLTDNIYKTTIVAFGRADNLLYLSAYATSNPLEKETSVATSLTNLFKLNGEFSNTLKNDEGIGDGKVVKFLGTFDRDALLDALPAAQSTGQANDLGLEDTYFITMDYFVNKVINTQVRSIVQSGLTYPLRDILTIESSSVGWNQNLRSTSPELMIINNKDAITQGAATQERIDAVIAVLPGKSEAKRLGSLSERDVAEDNIDKRDSTLQILNNNTFTELSSPDQGSALLSKGIWLNSKAIQAAFINARTMMEGLETLIRNMNAATEGYWDLKLYYDDDAGAFRILDDNLRIPKANDKIYEFNKRLTNTADIVGPEILDIEIKTDFPKLLFSQLAVAGINGGLENLSSDPNKRDVNFIRETSVRDIFAQTQAQPAPVQAPNETPPPAPGTPWASVLTNIKDKPIFSTLAGTRFSLIGTDPTLEARIDLQLIPTGRTVFPNGVPQNVSSIINEVFSNPNMLTSAQASGIRIRLAKENLTQDQSAVITELFGYRAIEIIRRDKQKELDVLDQAFEFGETNKLITNQLGSDVGPAKNAIKRKIEQSRDSLIQDIQNQLGRINTTVPGSTAAAEAVESRMRAPAPRAGEIVFGR